MKDSEKRCKSGNCTGYSRRRVSSSRRPELVKSFRRQAALAADMRATEAGKKDLGAYRNSRVEPILIIETNIGDKGKLFERGGRKALGTKLRLPENVGRAAVSKLRGLPFVHMGGIIEGGCHRSCAEAREDR